MIAAESRKEVELERDTLKQQVLDTQKECTTMKEAILALAEAEKHRVKTINKLERKLQKAKSSLKKVAALAKDAEDEASTLRETISKLQAENKTLSAELSDKKQYIENECNRHNEKLMTAKKEAKRWQLQVEDNCIEIKMLQMKLATAKKSGKPRYEELDITRATPNPNGSAMALINAFGAEDVTIGSELFNKQTFAEKQPMQTALLSPPGPSSRQLSYVDDKENQPLLIQKVCSAKQQKCCLCFKDTTGVMRSCQCGQKKCDKRAHATCLSKYKVGNIPSCVSHPGTPLPHMPLILCKGIWK
jgi:myosin heavy subunit